MMKTYITLFVAAIISFNVCKAQNTHQSYYPIGDDPNIGWKSSMAKAKKYETILFEANPIVRYSVYNNIYKLSNDDAKKYDHTQAWYVSYRPQLRMYTENSLPVRTPSYRILLGTQQVYRLKSTATTVDILAFSLESGHYSNGQDGGAFTDKYADGTPESDAVYKTITPTTDLSALLNRKSANFSTDLTEFIANYRFNTLDNNNLAKITHSIKLGGTLYHDRFLGVGNFGGYSDDDIKIYGRFRMQAGYQFIKKFDWFRYSIILNGERIFNTHPSVEPWRGELIGTVYPLKSTPDFGVYLTFVAGHDNYNYRFVDSGTQFGFGVSWSLFPPIKLKGVFNNSPFN